MKSSFSERVKIERERAGLSQTRLARMCDLSAPMISCLELGKSAGSEKVLVSVARALGVRPEWLRSGSGKRESDPSDDLAAFPRAAPQPFPERLRQLRKDAGLSQRQLANFVGVSTTAVSSWETGSREFPAGNNLVRLAEAIGLDPVEVMKVDGKSATARDEVQLLAAFRVLPKEQQLIAIKLVEDLKQNA
jgi:transcriptional regulator with XRE-family HTH domain